MDTTNVILLIGSYIVTFFIGRGYGIWEAFKIVKKVLDKYK